MPTRTNCCVPLALLTAVSIGLSVAADAPPAVPSITPAAEDQPAARPNAPVDRSRAVAVEFIAAPPADVWRAFTTADGLRSWMAPLVEIDLRVGGTMRSNYNADGELGDPTTITNTILSFDPGRMLSLKATGFPEGFAWADAAKSTWSVTYFEAARDANGVAGTRLTSVGLGYTDDPASQEMRGFFAQANAWSVDQLRAALAAARDE